jgi:hypothetical protein
MADPHKPEDTSRGRSPVRAALSNTTSRRRRRFRSRTPTDEPWEELTYHIKYHGCWVLNKHVVSIPNVFFRYNS